MLFFKDEAAGVMEGILDFGMAGIRKGLRLTGLQDNLPENTAKTAKTEQPKTVIRMIKDDVQKLTHPVSTKLPKWQTVAEDSKTDEEDDSVWVNPIGKDSPSFDGHILLVCLINRTLICTVTMKTIVLVGEDAFTGK